MWLFFIKKKLCFYIFKTVLHSYSLIFLDLILKVRPPVDNEVNLFKPDSTLISFLYPGQNKTLVEALGKKKINAFGK